MRILIVEDEAELLQDIAKGLTLKGYAVDQAGDGKRAAKWHWMKNMTWWYWI